MSRHVIQSLQPELEVVVGWDNPLQTYFAQVRRPVPEDEDEDEADPIVLWLGTSYASHPTLDSLQAELSPYAVLHPALLAQLRAEGADRTRPSALQQRFTRNKIDD